MAAKEKCNEPFKLYSGIMIGWCRGMWPLTWFAISWSHTQISIKLQQHLKIRHIICKENIRARVSIIQLPIVIVGEDTPHKDVDKFWAAQEGVGVNRGHIAAGYISRVKSSLESYVSGDLHFSSVCVSLCTLLSISTNRWDGMKLTRYSS